MRYSIVIPVHNEAENLPPLLHELNEVMESLSHPWELLIVDDASNDATWPMLVQQRLSLPQLRGIRLLHRSGQSAALSAGFKEARGDIVITLDGDGQNDPHDIPLLLAALPDVDCVTGRRMCREDPWTKRVVSSCANGLRRWLLGDAIQDTGCSLKVFRRHCLANLPLFKGMHRFLPSLLIIDGYRVKEVPVSHRPRHTGTSNYSIFNRGFSTINDLLAVWWMKRRHIHIEISQRLEDLSHDA